MTLAFAFPETRELYNLVEVVLRAASVFPGLLPWRQHYSVQHLFLARDHVFNAGENIFVLMSHLHTTGRYTSILKCSIDQPQNNKYVGAEDVLCACQVGRWWKRGAHCNENLGVLSRGQVFI